MKFKTLEALLYIQGDQGISATNVKDVFELSSISQARKLLQEFLVDFNQQERGIFVVQFNDTFKFATIETVKDSISKLVSIVKKQRLSNAAIETAGIIAYKQPITRNTISEIRGVNSDSIVASLLLKGIIEEVGIAPTPGNPILYGITNKFYDYFRIKSLNDLPKLTEFGYLEENSEITNDNEEAFDLFGSQREEN